MKKAPEGATHYPRGWRVHPIPLGARPFLVGHLEAPRCPSSGIRCILPWKNRKEGFGMKRRCLEVEPWRNQSRAPASCFAAEIALREGEIVTIVITIDPLIVRGSISINIFTKKISSQTLVHILYLIFVSKPQIGTCGLLVVLITPCS